MVKIIHHVLNYTIKTVGFNVTESAAPRVKQITNAKTGGRGGIRSFSRLIACEYSPFGEKVKRYVAQFLCVNINRLKTTMVL